MLKPLATAALALSLIAGPAAAKTWSGRAPWQSAAPAGLQDAHRQMAAAARQVEAPLAPGQFGLNPVDMEWNWQGDRNKITPLSNMSAAQINDLVVGRYQVLQQPGQKGWSLRYFGADGRNYTCVAGSNGRGREGVWDRHVTGSMFGLAGMFQIDVGQRPRAGADMGWPIVADPRTGSIAQYSWSKGRWNAESGWIQAEFPAVAAAVCPSMPRGSAVNQAQQGLTVQEIARGARAVTGFRTAFPNDVRVPLTAEMYYWLYPPAGVR